MFRVFLTNLGKYNEGELIGEWVDLPISDNELEEVLERIGCDSPEYEEYFITDYENDYGIDVHEYANITYVMDMAEQLEDLDDYQTLIFCAYIENGKDFDYAISHVDDAVIYYDFLDMTDVAYQVIDDIYPNLEKTMGNLSNYFDYEAYGRDLGFEGTFIFDIYRNQHVAIELTA